VARVVVGTMHAREAVRRGFEVVQLERDPEPRKASVRNFELPVPEGADGRVLIVDAESVRLFPA
jgi:hypothetical protein